MKFFTARALSICISILSIFTVHAQDGSFNFKGKITTAGCTIENPNLVYEGFTNRARWTQYEWSAYTAQGSTTIDINCGDLSYIPKVRFSAETGIVVGPQSGRKYLGTTGTASNIAFKIMWVGDGLPPEVNGDVNLYYDGKLYTLGKLKGVTGNEDGHYTMGLDYKLLGMKPYDESNNGTFESILGYELVYN